MRVHFAVALLAPAVAIPVSLLARGGGAEPADGAPELSARVAALARQVAELERGWAPLEGTIASLETAVAPAPAPARVPGDREIAEAVASWLDEHGMTPEDLSAGGRPSPHGSSALEGLDMAEIVRLFQDEGMGGLQVEELFQELREEGRIDEFVAWVEGMVAEDPQNPELQVALGVAYLQKLFDVGAGPQAGVLATKADQAFDRALELDPANWDARFTKAVALSNWPAFLGKSSEAIAQFEQLIAQQEESPPDPAHAQSYLFLGNMYLKTGEKDKAIAAWRKGLARFPDDAALLEQLRLNGQ